MKYNIWILILILSSSLVYSIDQTTFNNSETTENFTFTGLNTFTRYIDLPKFINITQGKMDLDTIPDNQNRTLIQGGSYKRTLYAI